MSTHNVLLAARGRACLVVARGARRVARARPADRRAGHRRLGHRRDAGRQGLPPGSGTAAQGAQVFAEKCALCHGEGGKGGPVARNPLFGGPPLSSAHRGAEDHRQFLGPRHHGVRLHPSGDAVQSAAPLTADEIYATTAYHPVPQQDHRRERRDGRQEPAAGEDAEPRQLHHPVSGPHLNGGVERDRPVLWGVDARGVATVTLNRPEVNNAYNGELIQGLLAALDALGARPACARWSSRATAGISRPAPT